MRNSTILFLVSVFALTVILGCGAPSKTESIRDRLIEWRTGVWLSSGGTYTIWTPEHYFVLSTMGDSTNANLYYACSQVSFHNMGLTRNQVQRFRELSGQRSMFTVNTLTEENSEIAYEPDTTLFDLERCVIFDGVIYDAVAEVTDEYILLNTCNGDREKIFSDGRSVYLPANGGEYYSYRVEQFQNP